jgi:hypothetical protein
MQHIYTISNRQTLQSFFDCGTVGTDLMSRSVPASVPYRQMTYHTRTPALKSISRRTKNPASPESTRPLRVKEQRSQQSREAGWVIVILTLVTLNYWLLVSRKLRVYTRRWFL